MTMITIIVCVVMIICISAFCEWRVEKALQEVFDAQTRSVDILSDAQAMYHVLLDIYDYDEDVVEEIVDNKKEELFS